MPDEPATETTIIIAVTKIIESHWMSVNMSGNSIPSKKRTTPAKHMPNNTVAVSLTFSEIITMSVTIKIMRISVAAIIALPHVPHYPLLNGLEAMVSTRLERSPILDTQPIC